ncbi:MAG: elongation factor P [Rickettsiales bacterium]|jgi:elongation factor P|nr:elongation factor P [Rickettsiales bacterium]
MNVNSLGIGNVIKFKGQYWVVAKKEHVKPGKGGAFVQLEIKNLLTGSKSNERFRAGEEVEKIVLEEREFQYQYSDSDSIFLMNLLSYEQEPFPKGLMGERIAYLVEGMNVKVCYCDDRVVEIKLPETVVLRIEETEPTVRGQTAAASYKPAILENGVRITVPQFITAGERVVVRTEDSSYVERAKQIAPR